jgi:hypothetical protein
MVNNMADLIDREEFYKRMRHAVSVAEEKELDGIVKILVGLVIPHLLTMPTVDAVPVVRCEDCQHYDVSAMRCIPSEDLRDYTDFCSYGERKDGE